MGKWAGQVSRDRSSSFFLDQLISPWTVHFIPLISSSICKRVCKYWHTCLTRTFWNNFAYVFIFTEHLHSHDLTYSCAHSFNKYHWRICYVPEFLPDSGNTDGPALRKLLLWWKTQESKQTIKAQCNRHYIVISVECFEILAMACETSREAVIIPVLQMRKLRFNKYNDLSKITNLVNGSLENLEPSFPDSSLKCSSAVKVYIQCIAK